jgi:hypothetical protein
VFIKSNTGAFYNCPMNDDYTSEWEWFRSCQPRLMLPEIKPWF